jgi:hypothetical protein
MNGMQDDLDWLDAVAGRPRAQADPRTLHEAALLRAAARTWAPRPLRAEVLATDPQALLARAEGVLGGRRPLCTGCAQRWRAWRARLGMRGGLGFAVAALLAAFVFGLLPSRVDEDAGPVLRGTQADGVWRLRAAEPAAQRDRIADELAAAGIASRRYERLGRFGLDAEPTPAQTAAAARLLDRLGVRPGADGVLRIEVEKDTP